MSNDSAIVLAFLGALLVIGGVIELGLSASPTFERSCNTVDIIDGLSIRVWLIISGASLLGGGVLSCIPTIVGAVFFGITILFQIFWTVIGGVVLFSNGAECIASPDALAIMALVFLTIMCCVYVTFVIAGVVLLITGGGVAIVAGFKKLYEKVSTSSYV